MERDGAIHLTEEGRHIAEKIYERHRVADPAAHRSGGNGARHSDASFEAVKRLTAERNGQ